MLEDCDIMTSSILIKPNWTYKPIDIPSLDLISSELLNIVPDFIGDIDTLDPDFIYIEKSKVRHRLPHCREWLQSLEIEDRWKYVAFITGNNGQSLPIHVDAIDWASRTYALNVPVLNCAGSFTVFYDAAINENTLYDSVDPRNSAYWCDQSTASEIDRVEANSPCWINISKPHQPVIHHDRPRILASFRFSPEVHDLFKTTD